MVGPANDSDMARDVFNQTLHPYTYPSELLKKHDQAKVTVNFTGSLIEQLNELIKIGYDPRLEGLWERYKETLKLRRAEFTGCAYFHPILPLLDEEDRLRQIEAHLKLFEETFGAKPEGFWLPELAFSMKVIPALAKMGVKWTIVDGPHVTSANSGKEAHELQYKPHVAEYEGYKIIVIPRDRMISIAQQSGYEPSWLRQEIDRRVGSFNDGEFLMTVATDGENGWFRHSGENAGFWGWFFEPLLNRLQKDPDFKFIRLTTISDYLKEHPPKDTVTVEDGSWNVPDTSDDGRFLKWTGGTERQTTWTQISETGQKIRDVSSRIRKRGTGCPTTANDLSDQAWRWLLMAEASDNFWWGSRDWLDRSAFCLQRSLEKMDEASKLCGFT